MEQWLRKYLCSIHTQFI